MLVAYSAQTRARVYVQAGRPARGLELFREARGLHEAAGLVVGEHLVEYADALSDLRLLPEALAAAREGAALMATDDTSLMAAEAELRVARLELATGDTAAAAQTAARAADRLRRQRRAPWVARAVLVAQQASGAPDPRVLRQVAGVLDDAGLVHDAVEAHLAAGRAAAACDDRAGAVRSLTRAATRARRAPLLVRLSGRLALAERAVLQGEPASSVVRSCRQGLDDLAAHRLALRSAELRALASGHGVELATLGLRALLPQASPARVLGWLELMRAAAIGGAGAAQPPQDEHLARLRALHAELDEARSRANRSPPPCSRRWRSSRTPCGGRPGPSTERSTSPAASAWPSCASGCSTACWSSTPSWTAGWWRSSPAGDRCAPSTSARWHRWSERPRCCTSVCAGSPRRGCPRTAPGWCSTRRGRRPPGWRTCSSTRSVSTRGRRSWSHRSAPCSWCPGRRCTRRRSRWRRPRRCGPPPQRRPAGRRDVTTAWSWWPDPGSPARRTR